MTIQRNAYVVMDTETSYRNGLVFDFGWTTIDKRGNVLGSGDLNFLDVITKEKPYYVNKIAGYANMPSVNATASIALPPSRLVAVCSTLTFHGWHAKAIGLSFALTMLALTVAFSVRLASG